MSVCHTITDTYILLSIDTLIIASKGAPTHSFSQYYT